ncbi:MAG: hypothetical protein NTX96_00690 [Candidatus Zambryskibacteria bacterium]|nr:hypothetical protein [Candidatus Zambryskibacteria bacterium]
MNKNLLISYDAYSKIKHEAPYFYNLNSRKQYLYYFGSNHTHDSQHPQFDLLMEKLNEFFSVTENKKRAIIVEREHTSNQCGNISQYIFFYGESGAGIFYANQTNSTLIMGEPSQKEIFGYLLNSFSKEEIILFYVCHDIKHWQKNKRNRSIETFLSEQTKKYREPLNWQELELNLAFINSIYLKMFGKDLDINDEKLFSQITTPVTIKSKLNEISRSQSQFRNEYILDKIEKYWNEGYNIFIIYGAGHAVMQEPAIRSLVS